ncbi:hypothetical protein H2200_001039 [Cladophialophora chaetospira]|uniref:Uncharacterized protein n=1 Tax=Cladophialophora chaetospira TaxID=386627 RepID=A0AA39CP78_9EURO|nr:hypothetical protein H2200_001039 [Cladophialophora chaetospira]
MPEEGIVCPWKHDNTLRRVGLCCRQCRQPALTGAVRCMYCLPVPPQQNVDWHAQAGSVPGRPEYPRYWDPMGRATPYYANPIFPPQQRGPGLLPGGVPRPFAQGQDSRFHGRGVGGTAGGLGGPSGPGKPNGQAGKSSKAQRKKAKKVHEIEALKDEVAALRKKLEALEARDTTSSSSSPPSSGPPPTRG